MCYKNNIYQETENHTVRTVLTSNRKIVEKRGKIYTPNTHT